MTPQETSGHERWTDTSAAYLLHALDDGEAEHFEAHLQQCRVCQDEIELLRMAADALPVAAVQVDPPAELKSRIMTVVEREAQLLRAAGPEADRPPVPEVPARRRLRWWPSMTLRPVTALAVVLVLVVGGVVIGGELERGPDRVLAGQAQIRGTSVDLELRDGRGRLAVAGLPAPPEGRVYQVWLDRGVSAPEPTNALFTPHEDGTGSVDVPGDLSGVRRVLVTHEPRGGSSVPTRSPILSVDLS